MNQFERHPKHGYIWLNMSLKIACVLAICFTKSLISAYNLILVDPNLSFLTKHEGFVVFTQPKVMVILQSHISKRSTYSLYSVVLNRPLNSYDQNEYLNISKTFRLIRPIIIIAVPLAALMNKANDKPNHLFSYYTNQPTTVLLIFLFEATQVSQKSIRNAYKSVDLLLCLKFYFAISNEPEEIKSGFWNCNDYCLNQNVLRRSLGKTKPLATIIGNAIISHKWIYGIGSGGQIVALIQSSCPNIFPSIRRNPHSVAEILNTLISHESYCFDANLRTIATLQTAHNVTFLLYHSSEIRMAIKEELHIKAAIKGEFLFSRVNTNEEITGMLSAKQLTSQIIYGRIRNNQTATNNYETWFAPFPLHLWCYIFCIPVVSALVTSLGQGLNIYLQEVVKLTKALVMFSSDFTCNWSKYIYQSVFLAGTFIFCLYQNEIVSLTIAPQQARAPQDLKQVLDFGYKLLWNDKHANSPNILFHLAFQKHKILDRLDFAFHRIKIDPANFLLQERNRLRKYSIIIEDAKRVCQLLEASFSLRNMSVDQLNCFVVPEKMLVKFLFWHIESLNRPWLMSTLQKLKESGLVEKWSIWSNFMTDLKATKVRVNSNIRLPPDVITISKVYPIVLLALLVNGAGLLVFTWEHVSKTAVEAVNLS